MKNKKLILIILSFLFIIAATFILGKCITGLMQEMVIRENPEMNGSQNVTGLWKIYVQVFFFLFAVLCLPLLLSSFIHKKNKWNYVIVLEISGVLLAFLTAPPDMISRIILFILWQIPVVINVVVMSYLFRRARKE